MEAIARKLMTKSGKKQKGMTLVELLAVIVILGIVAGIGTIAIGNIIENSRANADERKAEMIEQAAMMYVLDGKLGATATEITLAELQAGYYEGDGEKAKGGAFTKVTITRDATTNAITDYTAS